ncbi:MAG: hypothetical protein QXW00_00845 [Candidatus Woesearchaeota archaeon]
MKGNNQAYTTESIANSLIPEWLKSVISVSSLEELAFLGRNNLEEIIKANSEDIESIVEKCRALKGYEALLSGNNLEIEASKFENPQIAKEDFEIDSSGLPVPGTEELKERRDKSTTLNTCGWCQYNSYNTMIYNCRTDGKCSILSEGEISERRMRAYDECLLRRMSKSKIEVIKENIQKSMVELGLEYIAVSVNNDFLKSLAKNSEEKPYLPRLRPNDYYKVGDRIVIFASKKEKHWGHELIREGFLEGSVIEGQRHHEGIVSFIADEPFHRGAYLSGRGGCAGIFYAEVMLKDDFEYLKGHPEFTRLWLKNAECSERFRSALQREADIK